jgi:hypothetical protein
MTRDQQLKVRAARHNTVLNSQNLGFRSALELDARPRRLGTDALATDPAPAATPAVTVSQITHRSHCGTFRLDFL